MPRESKSTKSVHREHKRSHRNPRNAPIRKGGHKVEKDYLSQPASHPSSSNRDLLDRLRPFSPTPFVHNLLNQPREETIEFSTEQRESLILKIKDSQETIDLIGRRANAVDAAVQNYLAILRKGTLEHRELKRHSKKWQKMALISIKREAKLLRQVGKTYPPEWIRKVRIVKSTKSSFSKWRRQTKAISDQFNTAPQIKQVQLFDEAMRIRAKARNYRAITLDINEFRRWKSEIRCLLPVHTIRTINKLIESMDSSLKQTQARNKPIRTIVSRSSQKHQLDQIMEEYDRLIESGRLIGEVCIEIAKKFGSKPKNVYRRITRRLKMKKK